MDNLALKKTVKEIAPQSLSEEEIKTIFEKNQAAAKQETPEWQYKKENMVKEALVGVGDALNPFSEYNVKQHSGLVTATRREKLSEKEPLLEKESPIQEQRQRSNSVNVVDRDVDFQKEIDYIKTNHLDQDLSVTGDRSKTSKGPDLFHQGRHQASRDR